MDSISTARVKKGRLVVQCDSFKYELEMMLKEENKRANSNSNVDQKKLEASLILNLATK